MANMLRKQSHGNFGCCSACARNVKANTRKPGERERHQARAIEKRATRREIAEQG